MYKHRPGFFTTELKRGNEYCLILKNCLPPIGGMSKAGCVLSYAGFDKLNLTTRFIQKSSKAVMQYSYLSAVDERLWFIHTSPLPILAPIWLLNIL